MATRGALYRCHLFSFGGPQTEGVVTSWTQDLLPVGEREVQPGEVVELYARFESSRIRITAESRLRFDILEEDFILTGGQDDQLDSLVGLGAAAESGFTARDMTLETIPLGRNEAVEDLLDRIRHRGGTEYLNRIFVLEEKLDWDNPSSTDYTYHVLAFWTARREDDFGSPEYYFIVNVDNEIDDSSEVTLTVSGDPIPAPGPGEQPDMQSPPIPRDLLLEAEARAEVEADFQWENSLYETGAQPADSGASPTPTPQRSRQWRLPQPAPQAPSPVAAVQPEEWSTPHAHSDVENDHAYMGASPFDNRAVAIFHPWQAVLVSSRRYAVSYDFNRAIRWGQLLFGARAFAVIEGPISGNGAPRYFTVRTNYTYRLGGQPSQSQGGFIAVRVRYWQFSQPYHGQAGDDQNNNEYVVRLIGTSDGGIVFPDARIHARETVKQLLETLPADQAIDVDTCLANPICESVAYEQSRVAGLIRDDIAIPAIFTPIREHFSANRVEEGLRLLVDLNHNAFSLIRDTQERGNYLGRLLDALTLERRAFEPEAFETAILEVIRSINSTAELHDLLEVVRRQNKVNLIVDRLDSKLWDFLRDIGIRFGQNHSIIPDADFILSIFRSSISGNNPLLPSITLVTVNQDGSIRITPAILAQLEDAAQGFFRFGRESIAGIWTLITQPEMVIQGLGALLKAIVMLSLAFPVPPGIPYPPAVRYVRTEIIPALQNMLRGWINTWKGMLVLSDALSPDGPQLVLKILDRIRWAIIWEVASMFIGIGEINEGARLVLRGVDEAIGFFRASRAVRTGEAALSHLDDFARAAANSGLVNPNLARRVVEHLPEGDLQALERALARTETRGAQSIEDLARGLDTAGQHAVQNAVERSRVLARIEERMPGRLSNGGADAVSRLSNLPGATNQRLLEVINGLDEAGLHAFLSNTGRVPEAVFLRAGQAIPYESMEHMLLGRSSSFNRLLTENPDTLNTLFRHSGGDLGRLEKNFDALDFLRAQAANSEEAAAIAQRVARGEAAALSEIRDARRAVDLMRGRCL